MSCARPLAWETLVDWWAADLDEAATTSVEEHLLDGVGKQAGKDALFAKEIVQALGATQFHLLLTSGILASSSIYTRSGYGCP